jgi:V-type H+-transporting ATPase subunit a
LLPSIFQGIPTYKVVFILFFQGDQLRSRVRKICEAFRATLYQCPETAAERQKMQVAVSQRIEDLRSVLDTTQEHCKAQLGEIGKDLDMWQARVRRKGRESVLREREGGSVEREGRREC